MDTFDKYGNNTDFSDEILSDITIKGILGKWCQYIIGDVCYIVGKYHLNKQYNVDAFDMELTKQLFTNIYNKYIIVEDILEDIVIKNIRGLEDIFISVYGVYSDEVFIYREFKKLYNNIDNWNAVDMWTNCEYNKRLFDILKQIYS